MLCKYVHTHSLVWDRESGFGSVSLLKNCIHSERLMKDTLNKGFNTNDLHMKDTFRCTNNNISYNNSL